MSGIYIHIPFCKQACSYCDFYFVTRDTLIPAFVDDLLFEIHSLPRYTTPGANSDVLASPFPDDPVKTIYIGGGTPSRLTGTLIQKICNALSERFDLSALTEFTFEANPEDVTQEKLALLREAGITRLSMGIQSFQPELLRFMHRVHTADQAHHALKTIVDAGFSSFTVDLIYGCPNQTVKQVKNDLDQLLDYRPPHVSAYSLTIEPKTRLGKQAQLGRLVPAEDDAVALQARLIRNTLATNGLFRYEISNYAMPEHDARHNAAYWTHENYLGLGPAAHSFFWPEGAKWARRWQHPPDLHAYRQRLYSPEFKSFMNPVPAGPDELSETLSLKVLAGERLMTGLRTLLGVSTQELSRRYEYPLQKAQLKTIGELRSGGFMEPEDPLRLTDRGFEMADSITLRLIP